MAAQTAQPCFCEPVMRPSVYVRPAGIGEDQQKLQEIRERRGIFKRVRAVGVEESSSVCAEFLDGFLRGDRPLRDHLVGDGLRGGFPVGAGGLHGLRIDELGGVVGLEVLDHALRHENQGDQQRRRQQHPEKAPRYIDPEIADGFRFAARDAANDGDGDHDSDGGGSKVVVGEPGHLREVAHGGFAGVVLPVGVRGKRGGGIKGEIGCNFRRNAADSRAAIAARARSRTAGAC